MTTQHHSDEKNQEQNRNKFSTELHGVKEQAKEEFESAKNKGGKLLEDMGDQAKEYAAEAKGALTHYVEKNPLAAIGIAALAGAGLAFLLCR